MKEIPENSKDVKEVLLNQMALIKQESEANPDKLAELSHSLCELTKAYIFIKFCNLLCVESIYIFYCLSVLFLFFFVNNF